MSDDNAVLEYECEAQRDPVNRMSLTLKCELTRHKAMFPTTNLAKYRIRDV
jgi:hypothetical protein